MYLDTFLCGVVLACQKIASSQNEIPFSELHVPTNCKAKIKNTSLLITSTNKLQSHLGGGSFHNLREKLF
jgi:hypothetical protein